jgi:alpha-amylase
MQMRSLFTTVLRTVVGIALTAGAAHAAVQDTARVDLSPVSPRDPGSPLAADWWRGPFMEIYVRGFKDSNGDGIGDLNGITSQLDYLKSLGVRGIWLMPITASQDHDHGYAVSDYRALEPEYGTMADLDELLRQAHARGIGVIMDYVMNHSAFANPLFVNSRSAPTSRFRDWYVWQSAAPTGWRIYGNDPWKPTPNGAYFAGFWDQMPDFNLRNRDVISYHEHSMRSWLNRGIDGFRFDAVGNLVENGPQAWEKQPENYPIMGGVRRLLNGYAKRYMVCEAPADPVGFSASTACGSAFGFGLNYAIMAAVKTGDSTAVQRIASFFNTAPLTVATLLANHDAFAGERVWDQVEGNAAKYRLASGTLFALPGIPFIYYGEEIGMAGGAGLREDPKLRTPFSWTSDATTAGFTTGRPFRGVSANVSTHNVAAELRDTASLHAWYTRLLRLRSRDEVLRSGSIEQVQRQGSAVAFRRRLGSKVVWAVMNYGTTNETFRLQGLGPAQQARVLIQSTPGAAAMRWRGTSFRVTVAPGSMAIIAPGLDRAPDPRL